MDRGKISTTYATINGAIPYRHVREVISVQADNSSFGSAFNCFFDQSSSRLRAFGVRYHAIARSIRLLARKKNGVRREVSARVPGLKSALRYIDMVPGIVPRIAVNCAMVVMSRIYQPPVRGK